MAKDEPARANVVHTVDLHNTQQQRQDQHHADTKKGVVLLFVSAFLFSFMGMFLQITGRMGIPSTELVFIRAAFQGTFVVIGMVMCRVDDSAPNASESIGEDVGMVIIDEELLKEEKKTEDMSEQELLLPKGHVCKYNTLSIDEQAEPKTLSTRLILLPFGTTKCRNIVILRGIIGGFGFINYYYTLSTLPLGDATTLLSLYPIVTIFLARIVLGEEIKPLQLVASVLSAVGATLISRPTFLFGIDEAEIDQQRPPTLGYISALVGSLCASGVIVLIRKAGRMGAHTLQLLFSWTVFGLSWSIAVGVIAASNKDDQQWRVPSREEAPIVLGVCVSGTFAHFLLNYAAKLLPATLASLIRSSDIFWAYLLEIIVLGQHPQKETLFGAMLVCSSLALILSAGSNEKNKMKHLGSIGNLTAAK
ncbi:hypothetical protein ACHAXR_008579 [Thalassiosira sp. AJA248-18]